MYSSIVVGTDGSPTARNAVHAAAEVAMHYGATLHIVSAYRGNPAVAVDMTGMVPPVIIEDLVDDLESMLSETAEEFRRRGVTVETHAVPGDAAEAIIEVAKTHGAELIVVGNRGMTGARRLLGSVPNNVSHHAPCSVLIVKTT